MASVTQSNTVESVEIVPTGTHIGAEIRGVDLSRPVPEPVQNMLRDAWHRHLVVVFHDQELTPEHYVDAVRIFGEPKVGAARAYYEKAGRKSIANSLPYPEMAVLSNLDESGNPTESNDGLGSLEVVWHSDNSYVEEPPAGSTLYALEIPADGSGRTSFSNQYLAFEELPDELHAAIAGRRSKQDATRNSAGVLRPGVSKPESPENVPGPMHPLVRVHPVTGRKALYLGRRRVWPSQFVEGLGNEASEALLDRLWAHATQERYVWTHDWRVGDWLTWDNRCAMHYRTPINPTLRRVMWRSQYQGEAVVAG